MSPQASDPPNLSGHTVPSEQAGLSGYAGSMMLAGFAGAVAVAIGAFGAHWLEGLLADRGWEASLVARRMNQFETGVRYHLVHSLLLLLIAVLQLTGTASVDRLLRAASLLTILGIVLFSGSLYVLVLSGDTRMGAIVPIGGMSWILAWTLLAAAGWRLRSLAKRRKA